MAKILFAINTANKTIFNNFFINNPQIKIDLIMFLILSEISKIAIIIKNKQKVIILAFLGLIAAPSH